MTPSRKSWGAACAAAVLYVAWFVASRLADPQLPASGPFRGADLNAYFVPAMAFLRHCLLTAQLPLWNPFQVAGSPFLALHSPAALYPFVAPFALLPTHVAVATVVILHFVFVGLFTVAFARRIGMSASGALVAAIVFMGSAPLVQAAHNVAYLSTYAWLPAAFWAVEGAIRRPGLRSALILSGTLALGFLAGYSQGFLYIVQASLLFGSFRVARPSMSGQRAAAIGWAALAGALSLCLVAAQLLPTLAHAAGAVRNLDGLSLARAAVWALPTPFSEIFLGKARGPAGLPYLMVPLTLLAIFVRGKRALGAWFLVLLLASLDFMRGRLGVLFPLYFELPGGDLFRIPTRLAFVFQFSAAILMGFGATALGRMRQHTLRSLLVVLVVVGVTIDVWQRSPLRYRFDPISHPASLYGPKPLVQFLSKAGYDRVFVEGSFAHTVPRNLGTLRGLFTLPGYEPMLPGDYAPFFGMPDGIVKREKREDPWHGQLNILSYRRNRQLVQSPELLDLLSVRYYVDANPRSIRAPDRVGSAADAKKVFAAPAPVYEREQALPRAYVVNRWIKVQTREEAIALARSRSFDKRRTAIVQGGVASAKNASLAAGTAAIRSYANNHVTVDAVCKSSCLLVLTDLYDPDWKVRVDGTSSVMLRTNGILRGVMLERGKHSVVFDYRPVSFLLGAALSFSTLAGLMAAGWIRSRRRGHRR